MLDEMFAKACNYIDKNGVEAYQNNLESLVIQAPTVAIKVAKKYNIINDKYLNLANHLGDIQYITKYIAVNENTELVENMVLETENLLYIKRFASEIPTANVERINNVVSKMIPTYASQFAKSVEEYRSENLNKKIK